jgi:hypothetical protein
VILLQRGSGALCGCGAGAYSSLSSSCAACMGGCVSMGRFVTVCATVGETMCVCVGDHVCVHGQPCLLACAVPGPNAEHPCRRWGASGARSLKGTYLSEPASAPLPHDSCTGEVLGLPELSAWCVCVWPQLPGCLPLDVWGVSTAPCFVPGNGDPGCCVLGPGSEWGGSAKRLCQ